MCGGGSFSFGLSIYLFMCLQVPVLYDTSIRPRVLAAGLQQDDALRGMYCFFCFVFLKICMSLM